MRDISSILCYNRIMKISFFGHSDFLEYGLKEKVIELLIKTIGDNSVEFLLGEYGRFDGFACDCCQEIRRNNSKSKISFITPYIGKYLEDRKENLLKIYDEIIYPPIETTLKKFAILERNFWMIDQSDLVIVYVCRNFGGANTALEYAQKKNKKIINLCNL